MKSLKSQILESNLNLTNIDNNISIRVFRAIDDRITCDKFSKEQSKAFEHKFGTNKFASLNPVWKKNSNVYVIVAEDITTGKLIGGVRLHIATKSQALPIEKAAGLYEDEIYSFIEKQLDLGVCELCGLWISRNGLINGCKAEYLIRYFGLVADHLKLNKILILAGNTTVKFLKPFGAKVLTQFGNKGGINYPTKNHTFYITSANVPNKNSSFEEKDNIISIGKKMPTIVTAESKKRNTNIKYNSLKNLIM